MKKIILIIICVIVGSLLPLVLPTPNYLFNILGALIGLTIGLILFARKTTASKTASIPVSPLKKEIRMAPPKEEKEVDSKLITETDSLIQVGTDITIIPKVITEESYNNLLEPWDRGDHIFPAIDPLFKELLNREETLSETVVRIFMAKKLAYDPLSYFESLQKNPSHSALSAKTIMQYFIENQDKLGQRN